jgi:FHS family L-fucose permease-like MFS transporter
MASRNNSIVAPLPETVVKKHGAKTIGSNNAVTGAQNLTLKQSILPVCLVTILFFLWGFAYGLLDVLNAHFQVALNITKGQSGGLQAAYFGAYAIGPLTYSGWIVRRFGYRWAFITGLCIYGVGALMFWPSGLKRSFPGFCGSMFIVGSGLSTLETAANPFIATCGPAKYSELRLTLAQAFQAVGTVVAPILASQVIFKNVDDTSLQSVQWVYLVSFQICDFHQPPKPPPPPASWDTMLILQSYQGIAIFVFILAVVFFFAPIPEVTDADMAAQAASSGSQTAYEEKPLSKQYTLFFGVAAQFCYVGAQCAYAGVYSLFCKFEKVGANFTKRLLHQLCFRGSPRHHSRYRCKPSRCSSRMLCNWSFHR